MDLRAVQFHVNYVSTSDGDHYAAMLAEDDTDAPQVMRRIRNMTVIQVRFKLTCAKARSSVA